MVISRQHSLVFVFFFLFILLSSCSHSSFISVQTDYLSHESLASYHVQTPDPRLDNPPIGQRLIIMWRLPKEIFLLENLHLNIEIRFRNREQVHEEVEICKAYGTYVFCLINNDYFIKRGILSYKVELKTKETLIEEWRHQIWTDLISLEQKKSECSSYEQISGCNDEEFPEFSINNE